jgi:hypothetical protein
LRPAIDYDVLGTILATSTLRSLLARFFGGRDG